MRNSERDVALTAQKMTRRALVVGGLMTSVIAMIGGRMWQFGVRDELALLSEQLLPPDAAPGGATKT